MLRKVKKSVYIFLYILLIFAAMLLIIKFCFKYQARELFKRYIFSKVMAKEDDLERIVEIYGGEGADFMIHRSDEGEGVIAYKALGDKEIAKMFWEFHLINISFKNENMVRFAIYPYIDFLWWEGYTTGFYYSKDDQPLDLIGKPCELEYEEDGLIYVWYKTEKIMDNWWYYEWMMVPKINVKK